MNGHSTLYLSRFPRAQRGFTLVELSIVLVVIGLLIGGILVGQSLIQSAALNNTVKQIGQFDAGVIAFKEKYNGLPGDSLYFGGTGEGAITSSNTGWDGSNYTEVRVFDGEIGRFWIDLAPMQYFSGSQTAQPSGSQKNVPESKLGKSQSFFIASALSFNGYHVAGGRNPQNYYAILDPSQAKVILANVLFNTTTSSNSAVTPQELLSLDKKLDDGTGNTGNVISGAMGDFNGVGYGGIIATPLSTCSDLTTGVYDLTQTGYECTPLIRIGAQAGDPQ